jgi:molecular chaperone GrpE (heat shock protein)
VVAELRERLSVSKRAARKFDIERFHLRKRNDAEVEECQDKISNRFAALEILDVYVDINRAWENIRISKFQPERV